MESNRRTDRRIRYTNTRTSEGRLTRAPIRRPRQHRISGKAVAVVLLSFTIGIVIFALLTNTYLPGAAPVLPTENDFVTSGYEHDTEYDAYEETTVTDNSIRLVSIPVSDIADTGYMVLVNRWHAAPAMPYTGILTGAWPTVAVSRVYDMYLHHSALRAVSEMFASARQADIASFFVSSGFRSYDAQVLLYNGGANSAFVQPPGHSEHHTGLAADILTPGIGMAEMANTPEGQWLAANSYRYGLILRYPEGATEITGIEFEPWHFRYVGRAHAYYIKRNNFVLEEYIAHIHYNGHITFEKGGRKHHILHQIPHDGMIYVPYGLEHIISGDNKGGFIVIAW